MNQIIPNPHCSPEGKVDFAVSPEAGLCSQITFKNEDFWAGMSKAFGLGKEEEIIGVVFKDSCVLARFRLK